MRFFFFFLFFKLSNIKQVQCVCITWYEVMDPCKDILTKPKFFHARDALLIRLYYHHGKDI